jgi:hypothetical protein
MIEEFCLSQTLRKSVGLGKILSFETYWKLIFCPLETGSRICLKLVQNLEQKGLETVRKQFRILFRTWEKVWSHKDALRVL